LRQVPDRVVIFRIDRQRIGSEETLDAFDHLGGTPHRVLVEVET